MDEALYTVAGYLATPQRPYPLNGGVLNCPHPGQAGWLAEVVLRVDRKFKVLRQERMDPTHCKLRSPARAFRTISNKNGGARGGGEDVWPA